MKTNTLLLSMILLMLSFSCSDDPYSEVAERKLEVMPREDWYWKMNLDFITKQETISIGLKNSMIENGYESFVRSYATESYHYLNGAISHRIVSPNSPNEHLIVSQMPDSKLNFVIMNLSNDIVTYWQGDVFLAKFDMSTGKVTGRSLAYPGYCSELGPLRKGETFSECLVRNLENFCCDFTGCAALVAAPTAVAAAATIACTGLF